MGAGVLLGLLFVYTALVPGALLPAASWSSQAPAAIAGQRFTGRPAKGRFLVASHSLTAPNFSESVILLLGHEAGGSMGIVINRPTDVRLASLLPGVSELRDRPDRVSFGGPVGMNAMTLLIRARRQPTKSQPIFADVYASGDLDSLREALLRKEETEQMRAYVGYAGWGSGQLEQEIARGDWYVGPADAASVFDPSPTKLWGKLIDRFSGEWTREERPRLREHAGERRASYRREW
jgi:putative transcriptional regulator